MVGIPSIPYSQLKVTRSLSGGGALPGARVLLYNPATGKAIKGTLADGSGNYTFNNLDQDVGLQVITVSKDNFTCTWESDVMNPAPNPVWYGTDIVQGGLSVIGVTGRFDIHEDWVEASATIIDYIPYSYSLSPQGLGFGASVELRVGSTTNIGTFGITGVVVKSFGKNYLNPHVKIRGITKSALSGTIRSTDGYKWFGAYNSEGQRIYVNPVGRNGSTGESDPTGPISIEKINDTWYGRYRIPEDSSTWFMQCQTASISDQQTLVSALTSIYGADSTLWNSYNNSTSGAYTPKKVAAQIPNLTSVAMPSSCAITDQQAQAILNKTTSLFTEDWWPMSQTALEGAIYGVYLAIIEGQDTQDPSVVGTPANVVSGAPANRLDNSAFSALNSGTITSGELQYLKGWLAMETQVKPFVNRLGGDYLAWMIANYPAVDSVYRDLNNVIGWSLLRLHNIAEAFHRDGSNGLAASLAKEWQDVYAQSPGITDASQGTGIDRVRVILLKMQAATGKNFTTGLITQSSTGERYRWNFSGNTLTRELWQ